MPDLACNGRLPSCNQCPKRRSKKRSRELCLGLTTIGGELTEHKGKTDATQQLVILNSSLPAMESSNKRNRRISGVCRGGKQLCSLHSPPRNSPKITKDKSSQATTKHRPQDSSGLQWEKRGTLFSLAGDCQGKPFLQQKPLLPRKKQQHTFFLDSSERWHLDLEPRQPAGLAPGSPHARACHGPGERQRYVAWELSERDFGFRKP